jgi:hypothetical protein
LGFEPGKEFVMLYLIHWPMWNICWLVWLPLMFLGKVALVLEALELYLPATCIDNGVQELSWIVIRWRDRTFVTLGGKFPEGWFDDYEE